MNKNKFFERKCYAITSNDLLEFMKRQTQDSSLLLEITEDKEIWIISKTHGRYYDDYDIAAYVEKELGFEINNVFVDGDEYGAGIYFTERKLN